MFIFGYKAQETLSTGHVQPCASCSRGSMVFKVLHWVDRACCQVVAMQESRLCQKNRIYEAMPPQQLLEVSQMINISPLLFINTSLVSCWKSP